MEHQRNGVCIINGKGMVVCANDIFAGMLGYASKDETGNLQLKNLFATAQEFVSMVVELTKKKVWAGEALARCRDNRTFKMYVLASIIENKTIPSPVTLMSIIDSEHLKEDELKKETLYRGVAEIFTLSNQGLTHIETKTHLQHISFYSKIITEKLKGIAAFENTINDKYIEDISYASMLHDIGNWRIPADVLLKPGKLTEEEWKAVKEHPRLGMDMLSPLIKDKNPNLYQKLAENVIMYHHERWDGSGYPCGLKGDNIPLPARIVALCDSYDALTSDRPFRKAFSHDETYAILERENNKYDPQVWHVFKQNYKELQEATKQIS